MTDYGPIRTHGDLIAALKARRIELGLSQLDVDDIAELQGGYTGKLECGERGLGEKSFVALLGALGVVLRIDCSPATVDVETYAEWAQPAQSLQKRLRQAGQKGGLRRWGESLPEERRKAMRKVWMARVKKNYGKAGVNPANPKNGG